VVDVDLQLLFGFKFRLCFLYNFNCYVTVQV